MECSVVIGQQTFDAHAEPCAMRNAQSYVETRRRHHARNKPPDRQASDRVAVMGRRGPKPGDGERGDAYIAGNVRLLLAGSGKKARRSHVRPPLSRLCKVD